MKHLHVTEQVTDAKGVDAIPGVDDGGKEEAAQLKAAKAAAKAIIESGVVGKEGPWNVTLSTSNDAEIPPFRYVSAHVAEPPPVDAEAPQGV